MIEGLKEIKWWEEPTLEESEEEHQYGILCNNHSEEVAKKSGRRYWGRWYLNTSRPVSLDTSIFMGKGEDCRRFSVYDISLSRCNTEAQRKNWLSHMSDKNWMSEKGIEDLARAFEDLLKEGEIKR